MSDTRSTKTSYVRLARPIVCGLVVALAALAVSGTASAQDQQDNNEDKKDVVTFPFVPVQPFIDCLRANSSEEPKARATVISGKQNDTLILDLDGVRPALAQ